MRCHRSPRLTVLVTCVLRMRAPQIKCEQYQTVAWGGRVGLYACMCCRAPTSHATRFALYNLFVCVSDEPELCAHIVGLDNK